MNKSKYLKKKGRCYLIYNLSYNFSFSDVHSIGDLCSMNLKHKKKKRKSNYRKWLEVFVLLLLYWLEWQSNIYKKKNFDELLLWGIGELCIHTCVCYANLLKWWKVCFFLYFFKVKIKVQFKNRKFEFICPKWNFQVTPKLLCD